MKKKSTNQNNGLWTASYGEIGATLKALQDNGVTPDHLARLRSEPEYTKRVAKYIIRGSVEDSMRNKLARVLMGKNFFGIDDWIIYGANFTEEQLRRVAEFPWSEDILMNPCPFVKGMLVRDTHFAFLGVPSLYGEPLTVKRWLKLRAVNKLFRLVTNIPLAGLPHFDKATLELRWYLLLKDIVPDSDGKAYEEQVTKIPAEYYEIPTTIAEIMKNVLVFHKTGERPNSTRWAACKERIRTDNNITTGQISCVGPFNSASIGIHGWSGNRNIGVGLAASRKSGV